MWYIDEEWYIKKVKFESNLSISRNLLSIDREHAQNNLTTNQGTNSKIYKLARTITAKFMHQMIKVLDSGVLWISRYARETRAVRMYKVRVSQMAQNIGKKTQKSSNRNWDGRTREIFPPSHRTTQNQYVNVSEWLRKCFAIDET